ncbi:MAG: hypothetical protein ACLQPD_01435 [Desulfomonilaceae bacterium]
MKNLLRNLSLAYAAGSVGGLITALAVWVFGVLGITGALGVKFAPALAAEFLYRPVVWGGLWGFLFLLPFFRNSRVLRGIVYSAGPTLVQLFVVFPFMAKKGMLGLQLGALTPLVIVFFNIIWGITVAYWLHYVEDPSSKWKR